MSSLVSTARKIYVRYDRFYLAMEEYIRAKVVTRMWHTDYTKFVIVSGPRTGSWLLASLLNSHPNILCGPEIFHSLRGRSSAEILDGTYPKLPTNITAKGFKIAYGQPMDSPNSDVWKVLASMDDLYIIHLFRRDTVRQIVSWCLANATDVWVKPNADLAKQRAAEGKRISIAPDKFRKMLEAFNDDREFYSKLFEKRPTINVFYEDLIGSRARTMREVTDFINQPYGETASDLQKQNPHDISVTLKNYAELKESFAGTEYASSFDS